MSSAPFLFLSPALPSELLTYILNHHVYPTTLIICSSRQDFLTALADDVYRETACPEEVVPVEQPLETTHSVVEPEVRHVSREQVVHQRQQHHQLISSPLHQVAVSRHIRVIYTPTVTHLRAYLSVFSPDNSKVPVPPAGFNSSGEYSPCILLYGFLETHRDTSEWSAQGISNSASIIVELGHRLSWPAVLIEPRRRNSASSFENLLRENVPFLSGGGRRPGPDAEAGGWAGRTVEVGRVMRRWFDFHPGIWDAGSDKNNEETPRDEAK